MYGDGDPHTVGKLGGNEYCECAAILGYIYEREAGGIDIDGLDRQGNALLFLGGYKAWSGHDDGHSGGGRNYDAAAGHDGSIR